MMGEYVVYYRDRVIGRIYGGRFLFKPVETAKALLPHADYQIPYEGAKEMLLVDSIENRALIMELPKAMYPEQPAPKKKR